MEFMTYEYETVIQKADAKGGAYVAFPYDIRKEFQKGRVKVHVTFDGEPYDGSIVNMGVKNADGSICYIIGIKKEIRAKIGKQPGDMVFVTVVERGTGEIKGMGQDRLAAFEAMLAAVQKEYEDILLRMEKLKADKKGKTVTYQQLFSRKLMYQNMLSLYQLYGLVKKEDDTDNGPEI